MYKVKGKGKVVTYCYLSPPLRLRNGEEGRVGGTLTCRLRYIIVVFLYFYGLCIVRIVQFFWVKKYIRAV